MVGNLQTFLLVIFSFGAAFAKGEMPDEKVSVFAPLIQAYSAAYQKADFSVIQPFTVSEEEYRSLLSKLEKVQPDCLTSIEREYDVRQFRQSFDRSHLLNIISDTLIINNVQVYNTCDQLDVRKIACDVYYNNRQASVTVQVIVLKIGGEYKILTDVINENHFTDK